MKILLTVMVLNFYTCGYAQEKMASTDIETINNVHKSVMVLQALKSVNRDIYVGALTNTYIKDNEDFKIKLFKEATYGHIDFEKVNQFDYRGSSVSKAQLDSILLNIQKCMTLSSSIKNNRDTEDKPNLDAIFDSLRILVPIYYHNDTIIDRLLKEEELKFDKTILNLKKDYPETINKINRAHVNLMIQYEIRTMVGEMAYGLLNLIKRPYDKYSKRKLDYNIYRYEYFEKRVSEASPYLRATKSDPLRKRSVVRQLKDFGVSCSDLFGQLKTTADYNDQDNLFLAEWRFRNFTTERCILLIHALDNNYISLKNEYELSLIN